MCDEYVAALRARGTGPPRQTHVGAKVDGERDADQRARLLRVEPDDLERAMQAAMSAFDERRPDDIRRALAPLAAGGNGTAGALLGTLLALGGDPEAHDEGVRLLRALADAGDGHAAHNLATALLHPPPGRVPDRAGFERYMAIAEASGFEAAVASDPAWWRR